MPSRTAAALANSLKKIVNVYARGGFLVCVVLMDMEFEKLKTTSEGQPLLLVLGT